MPYFKCKECHHEFEAVEFEECDWCGAADFILLEERTPLEKMFDNERKDDG